MPRLRFLARQPVFLIAAVGLVLFAWRASAQHEAPGVDPVSAEFYTFVFPSTGSLQASAARLDAEWQPGFAAMGIEVLRFAAEPTAGALLIDLLEAKTGQAHGYDVHGWQNWLWNQPEHRHTSYAAWKAALYKRIDPKFEAYFDGQPATDIRLDEVVWGGVAQDGIPPLRDPKMLAAGEADYLGDDNVVFGIEVGGDARAYPKRILAWHEMFTDTIAGERLAGVYCTLCGTVILYKTAQYSIGTSGFLYRSNKLMYDKGTSSLWNTFRGQPVVGPLVGKGIELERLSVVTTTWGEWRRRHPQTTVLSLDTGHRRDYGEGVAYHNYFATDELMFSVPQTDRRLANKAEVLALLLPAAPDQPLAIDAGFLSKNPVWHDAIGGTRLVVLTDPSGANRVYASGETVFAHYDGDVTATAESGERFTLTEAALTGSSGTVLHRLPYHRAFWFGWYAAYPHTRLVKG